MSFKYSNVISFIINHEKVGEFYFPAITPEQYIPDNVISFNEIGQKDISANWIDHFIDDSQFSRVYNNFQQQLPKYKRAKGVIGTDFSAYRNMPKWMRIGNIGKNRTIDAKLQANKIKVIPVASWAYIKDLDWSLDGLPSRSTIAISTNGVLRNLVSFNTFIEGVDILQKVLRPSLIVIAGPIIKELDKYDNILYYPNFSQRIQRRIKNGK